MHIELCISSIFRGSKNTLVVYHFLNTRIFEQAIVKPAASASMIGMPKPSYNDGLINTFDLK